MARECLSLRCTEASCPYRATKLGAKAAAIEADGRIHILESMMAEAEGVEDAQQGYMEYDSAGAT
eukprot:3019038-Lingulodinium_polyedra.AAC.1